MEDDSRVDLTIADNSSVSTHTDYFTSAASLSLPVASLHHTQLSALICVTISSGIPLSKDRLTPEVCGC